LVTPGTIVHLARCGELRGCLSREAVISIEVTGVDFSRTRGLVAQAARAIEIPADRVGDLVTAVNEVVVNAIRYAGGSARLTIEHLDGGVRIVVSDDGPGLPGGVLDHDRRAPSALGGRGLGIAWELFPDMTVSSTAEGVTVRFFATVQD
jgi:serine/threonine-protein kinase RsbW